MVSAARGRLHQLGTAIFDPVQSRRGCDYMIFPLAIAVLDLWPPSMTQDYPPVMADRLTNKIFQEETTES